MDCTVKGLLLLSLKKRIQALSAKIKKSKLEIEFIRSQIQDPERLENHKTFMSGQWDTCGSNFYSRPSYEHTEDDFKKVLTKIDGEISNYEKETDSFEGELEKITGMINELTISE